MLALVVPLLMQCGVDAELLAGFLLLAYCAPFAYRSLRGAIK